MDDDRRATLLKVLVKEYGIKSGAELLDAIHNMEKLDITQFLLRPHAEIKEMAMK